jgi:hypothetical protein
MVRGAESAPVNRLPVFAALQAPRFSVFGCQFSVFGSPLETLRNSEQVNTVYRCEVCLPEELKTENR